MVCICQDCPPAQGLYDPAHEHDACGVGFVVHVKGQPLARDRRAGAQGPDQPAASRRLRLRGEHRRRRRHSHPDAGPFLRREAARLGIRAASRAALRRRVRVPAARRRPRGARSRRRSRRSSPRRGSACSAGATCRPTTRRLGPSAVAVEPVLPRSCSSAAAGVRRPPATDADMRFERKLYVIRKRVEHAVDAMALPDRSVVLRAQPVVADDHLQGHADGEPDCADVPRPGRSGRRIGARAGAPAVQHQHVPVLAAGAPVPLRRAQRRDQHAARQHQLDEGARSAARVGRASATT